MSVSSVNSSNPYSYLQWPQTDSSDSTDQSGAPTDPLQALFQSFSGGGSSSSDPLLAAIGQDDSSSSLPNFQFSPDMMQQLFSVQGDQSQASSSSSQSGLQSLLGQFDANGDGQISQSEFENAIGPDADKSKVDALFNKIDSNGDGSISSDEMKSAAQKAHGGGHHHHHAGGAGGSGIGGWAGGRIPLAADTVVETIGNRLLFTWSSLLCISHRKYWYQALRYILLPSATRYVAPSQ